MNEGSFFLIKKKERKRKRISDRQTDTHTYSLTHKDLCLVQKIRSQSGFRIKRGWDGPGGHAHCWALLGRYLMVSHDANSYKQQALPNSGNTCGQLGGWTFLDMHTHAKLSKHFKKMSLLKSQVQVGNIARISASDTLSLRQGSGCRLEGWRPRLSLQLSQYGSLCRPLTQPACGSSPQSSLRDANGPSRLESVVGTSHQLHFHVKTEGPRRIWVGGHVPPHLLAPPPD